MSDLKTQGRGVRSRLPLMDRPAVLDSGQAPYWTSGVLGVVAGTGALLSVLFPGVLKGEPALDGNLRGTALVVLVVVLPLLALAMVRTAHGSARWLVVWLAAVAHLHHQGFMFSFATPAQQLLPAVRGAPRPGRLGGGCAAAARAGGRFPRAGGRAAAGTGHRFERARDRGAERPRVDPRGAARVLHARPAEPARGQRADDQPGLRAGPRTLDPRDGARGGLALAATFVGALLTGGLLAFASLECVTIAVDQWYGGQADGTSTWAPADAVPVFAAAAVLVALPVVRLLLDVDRARR